jgi:hypothetical protein
MNSYNGFSGEQRQKAQNWLNVQWKNGALKRPDKCCACGNTGIVDAHAEDYSEPFGNHLQEYPLCFVCHMMVHCRFYNKKKWLEYIELIRQGFILTDFKTRNFFGFKSMFLTNDNDIRKYIIGKTERIIFPLDKING